MLRAVRVAYSVSAAAGGRSPWAPLKQGGAILRKSRFRVGIAVLAVGALGVGMATSSASASKSARAAAAAAGIAHAKAALAAAAGVPKFTLKAPSFDIKKIKGKTIFDIPVTSAVPYVVSVDLAAQAVFQSYGAKWVEYTNQGTPTQWTAGISQAIAQHAASDAFWSTVQLIST